MQTPKNSNRFLKLQEDTECMEESRRQRGHGEVVVVGGKRKFDVLPPSLQTLLYRDPHHLCFPTLQVPHGPQ